MKHDNVDERDIRYAAIGAAAMMAARRILAREKKGLREDTETITGIIVSEMSRIDSLTTSIVQDDEEINGQMSLDELIDREQTSDHDVNDDDESHQVHQATDNSKPNDNIDDAISEENPVTLDSSLDAYDHDDSDNADAEREDEFDAGTDGDEIGDPIVSDVPDDQVAHVDDEVPVQDVKSFTAEFMAVKPSSTTKTDAVDSIIGEEKNSTKATKTNDDSDSIGTSGIDFSEDLGGVDEEAFNAGVRDGIEYAHYETNTFYNMRHSRSDFDDADDIADDSDANANEYIDDDRFYENPDQDVFVIQSNSDSDGEAMEDELDGSEKENGVTVEFGNGNDNTLDDNDENDDDPIPGSVVEQEMIDVLSRDDDGDGGETDNDIIERDIAIINGELDVDENPEDDEINESTHDEIRQDPDTDSNVVNEDHDNVAESDSENNDVIDEDADNDAVNPISADAYEDDGTKPCDHFENDDQNMDDKHNDDKNTDDIETDGTESDFADESMEIENEMNAVFARRKTNFRMFAKKLLKDE